MTPNAERPAIVISTAAELTNIQDDMWAPEGTKSGFAIFLVFLAVIGGFLGLLFASQATMGVAFLAFSILLAVFARIVQANAHHAAMMKQLRRR